MARTEGKKEVRRKKDPVVILAGISGSDPIAYDPYRSTDSEGSSGSSVVEDIDELVLSYQAHKNVKSRVRSRGRTKTIAVKRKVRRLRGATLHARDLSELIAAVF